MKHIKLFESFGEEKLWEPIDLYSDFFQEKTRCDIS